MRLHLRRLRRRFFFGKRDRRATLAATRFRYWRTTFDGLPPVISVAAAFAAAWTFSLTMRCARQQRFCPLLPTDLDASQLHDWIPAPAA